MQEITPKLPAARASSRRLLILIGLLYVSQGIPMGLAMVAYPAILRTLGYSTEAIGMLGLVALPWVVKFLWAPIVDRAQGGPLGKRLSWIVPAQALCVLLYGVIALLPQGANTDVLVVIAILFAINIISATQDIATDGLAVERLRGSGLAHANGLQIGAFSFGMMAGGSVTVILYDHGGWATAFSALSALMVVSLVMALLVREPPQAASASSARASLRNTLNRPGAMAMITVAGLFYFAHAMVGAMIGPFFVDAGLSLTDIGLLNGLFLSVSAGIGALLGAFLAGRFGAPRSALATGGIAAISLALWLMPAASMTIDFPTAFAIMTFVGVFGFASYTSFFTLLMQWASPDQAGTDFTVLQCSETCFGIAAGMLAGQLAGSIGFAAFFGVAAGVGCVALVLISVLLARRGPYPLGTRQQ